MKGKCLEKISSESSDLHHAGADGCTSAHNEPIYSWHKVLLLRGIFQAFVTDFTPWWEWCTENGPSGTICAGAVMAFCANRARGCTACGRYLLDISLTFSIKDGNTLWTSERPAHSKTRWQSWKFLCRSRREERSVQKSLISDTLRCVLWKITTGFIIVKV